MTAVLPDFLCAGTSRADTTSIRDILHQHTDILLPAFKDAGFLDIGKNYHEGMIGAVKRYLAPTIQSLHWSIAIGMANGMLLLFAKLSMEAGMSHIIQ